LVLMENRVSLSPISNLTSFGDFFFKSLDNGLLEILETKSEVGEFTVQNTPAYKTRGMATMVYLTGLRNGRVIIDMETKTALAIAGHMNASKFDAIDELVRASIAEFANLVVCHVICDLQDAGFAFSVSPPTVLEGKNMTLSTPTLLPMMLVEFRNPLGAILFNLALANEEVEK
jgi:CheY-specific phosphatase CheX